MTMLMKQAEIDPKAFRRALGNFATGVAIITARAPDGTSVGVTASSFNSLSMDPPLILWSSMKDARSCAIFESATHFAVNILASDQMDMSNHFARQQEDKFAGVDWEPGIGGAPIFPNCAGRFQCETYDKLDGGDHWIFVGRVVAFDDFGRAPLCFHQGSYAMVFNHPGSFPKSGEDALEGADGGRMGNHPFFLMLRAVRAYQDRYQPKLETLGLSVIEARILLVLTDISGLSAEQLVVHLHAPVTEARVALSSLGDCGLVAPEGEGHVLTEAGRAKAEECWNLAEAHAGETFKSFSDTEVDCFTGVLRKLIKQ
ncbi:p-hydroxyphenylacetate 3-hydroxylase reductase component [Cribrihabitans pelagius]|uniref:p-hydroxyphenylacetate 3-hydroxylase reductase component n=1 Tax=Cribrihabitans pelagius TaxID=1765746 RepID=UPI003B5AFDCE